MGKGMKILIIVLVVTILLSIVYMKMSPIQTSQTTTPAVENTETVTPTEDTQATETKQEDNLTDSERFAKAKENDLPTMLEFKTSS